jgi:hypothetical protein
MKIIFFIAVFFLFISGLVFYVKSMPTSSSFNKEGFETSQQIINDPTRCPNMLIQKGARYHLYNSRLAQIPGVNPVTFDTLEDYSEFLDWQHANGIHCPVLFLQQSINAQGKSVYQIRPSVTEPQGGLSPFYSGGMNQTRGDITLLTDATHNDPPYNVNSYPAYDQTGQNIGQVTPLDTLTQTDNSNPLYPSPNPMDPNWGGPDFTEKLIENGAYADNEVDIYVP